MKHERSTTLGCKDIEIRKYEFVASVDKANHHRSVIINIVVLYSVLNSKIAYITYLIFRDFLFILENIFFWFKGTVRVISSDFPWNDDNAR